MNEEFVNTYIEKMNEKIGDLMKTELLIATRLTIAEKVIASFRDENEKLKSENEKLAATLNKRAVKNKEASDF